MSGKKELKALLCSWYKQQIDIGLQLVVKGLVTIKDWHYNTKEMRWVTLIISSINESTLLKNMHLIIVISQLTS